MLQMEEEKEVGQKINEGEVHAPIMESGCVPESRRERTSHSHSPR